MGRGNSRPRATWALVRHRFLRSAGVLSAAACLLVSGLGCDPRQGAGLAAGLSGGFIDPPSSPSSLAPRLNPGPLLSWLEPIGDSHRFRFSRLTARGWSPAMSVEEGDGFFANWADVPSVVQQEDGTLLAHWLQRLGQGTYSYGVRLAHSRDRGSTWSSLGWLHDDETEAEHGFVALLPSPAGTWGFWLDGRSMPGGGDMALRGRLLGSEEAASRILDSRVCECCQTDAAWTSNGPLVVYRGRSGGEVRDIRWLRLDGGTWTAPKVLAPDGWEIAGCPVNGPAVAASGVRVAVSWFTAAEGRPRVQAAFSANGGESFGASREVDGDKPLGRVDVAYLGEDDFAVSWMASLGERAALKVRRVRLDGTLSEALTLATTASSRASGVPRIQHHEGELLVTWVETGDQRKIRVLRIEASSLPGTS